MGRGPMESDSLWSNPWSQARKTRFSFQLLLSETGQTVLFTRKKRSFASTSWTILFLETAGQTKLFLDIQVYGSCIPIIEAELVRRSRKKKLLLSGTYRQTRIEFGFLVNFILFQWYGPFVDVIHVIGLQVDRSIRSKCVVFVVTNWLDTVDRVLCRFSELYGERSELMIDRWWFTLRIVFRVGRLWRVHLAMRWQMLAFVHLPFFFDCVVDYLLLGHNSLVNFGQQLQILDLTALIIELIEK